MKIQKLDIDTHDTKKVSELIYETDEDLFLAVLDKNSEKAVEKLQNIVETGKILTDMKIFRLHPTVTMRCWAFSQPSRGGREAR